MVLLYRLIIKRVKKDSYIGVSFTGKKYKVNRNRYIGNLKEGADVSFFARKEKGFLKEILIPISDEEVGIAKL